jgi:signal peptidase I
MGGSKLDQKEAPSNKKSFLVEILQSLVIAAVLAFIIHTFVMQNFRIPSASMEPTLQVQDYIFASKLSYKFSEPQRGDIIVFKYPKDTKRYFVKRLIAVGGETVALRDSKLYIDGYPVFEEYLPQGLRFPDFSPVDVPQGSYFMLGDNRNNSSDSRDWGFVPEKLIVGKEIFIYWPPSRIGVAH